MDTAFSVLGGEGGLTLMLTAHFLSSVECSVLPNTDCLYPYLKHRGLVLEEGCDLELCAKLFCFYVLQAVKSFNLMSTYLICICNYVSTENVVCCSCVG